MAFINEATTTLVDLMTKLSTFMSSNGWGIDHPATGGTNDGDWAATRTGQNLRVAARWDDGGTIENMGIYHYVDQAWVVGNRAWAQANDSGNGALGATPPPTNAEILLSRHVQIGNTPIQYWAFEGTGTQHYTHVVVEKASGLFVHFGFGILRKYGDWNGGEYAYGHRWSRSTGANQAIRDGSAFLLDGLTNDTSDVGDQSNDMEDYAASIHCNGLPNQPASGKFAVSMGGKAASHQTDFSDDRQGTPRGRACFTHGLRSGFAVNGFHRMDGSDLSGQLAMWPILVDYHDDVTNDMYGPMGYMEDVRGLSIRNYVGGQEVVQGGDTWVLFPAYQKGTGTGTTSNLGIAYKQVS